MREDFGVEELTPVVEGSMGAQQVYEWTVRFPEKVKRAAPIAGTVKNTPHDFPFTQALMDAITTDPGYNGGWYAAPAHVREGLVQQGLGWSVGSRRSGGSRSAGASWVRPGRGLQGRVRGRVLQLARPEQPHRTRVEVAARRREPAHGRDSLAAALGRITARTFVMPISEDMFFPARLRRRAEAHPQQRAAHHRRRQQPLEPLRLRAGEGEPTAYLPNQPPSTGRTEPWIKSPAAEASRTTAPFRSSGSP